MLRLFCLLPLALSGPPASREVEDASALVQRLHQHVPAADRRCRARNEGLTALFSDADRLKKLLDQTSAVVKVVGGVTKKGRGQEVKESREGKAREGATRTAMREQLRAVLQRVPQLTAGSRGVLVSWAVPQIMELRRRSSPSAQSLIDNVAAVQPATATLENLDVKATQLSQALQKAGHPELAGNVSAALPELRRLLSAGQQLKSAKGSQGQMAAALLRAAGELGASELKPPVRAFITDIAGLMEEQHSAEELKRIVPQRAQQLFTELNVTLDTRGLATFSEMLVSLAPRLLKGQLRTLDVVPFVSRLMSDYGVGQQLRALPTVLDFIADVSALNQQTNVDRGQVLARLARFIAEMDVFDKVGGPMGAVAALLSDLAKPSGGGKTHVLLRVARLANELHLVNGTSSEGLAAAYMGAAHLACAMPSISKRSQLCGSLPALVPAATVAAPAADEAVGHAAGKVLLQLTAAPRRGSPMLSGLFEQPCVEDHTAAAVPQVKKPRSQSQEAKRREPATRAAVKEELSALLSKALPQMPGMARAAAVTYVLPKLMELRRESEPGLQALMDRLATMDWAAAAPLLRGLASPPKEATPAGQAAALLEQAEHVAELLQVQGLPQALAGLAQQLRAPHTDAQELLAVVDKYVQEAKAGSVLPQAWSAVRGLLVHGNSSQEVAELLPKAAALLEGLGPLQQEGAKSRLTEVLDDAGMLLCAIRGPRQQLPQVCAAPAVAPAAAVAAAAPAEVVAQTPKATMPPASSQLARQPEVQWHRRHTEG